MLPVVFIAVLGVVFLVVHSIQRFVYHYRRSKSLHCKAPAYGGDRIDRYFGIRNYLRVRQSVKEKRFLEFQNLRLKEVGKNTMSVCVLGKPIVMTIEPENVKAMLATQFRDYCLGSRLEAFHPFLGYGIFTLDGQGWSKARGLLRPQFSKDQVTDLALVDDHITRLIQRLPQDKSAFDIQDLFFLFTLDSATHFLFGESVESLIPTSSSHQSVLEKYAVGSPQGFAKCFNLSQEYLTDRARASTMYWLIDGKEFRDSNQKIHEVVDHYVRLGIQQYNEKRKRYEQDKGFGSEMDNERYVFLQALAADTQDPTVLRDNLLNILLAGRDTTASLLSSAFYYFARHQNVWNRLRKEILDVFGDAKDPKAEITHARLKDIAYLRYVLNETLRLLPPVPINFRVAATDTTLPVGGGPDQKSPVYIKKDSQVAYSVYSMHRRTDIWGPDANVFRPERWEENAKHGWEYLPFNGGPRICLGQQYALTEASYVLVKLLQHFDTVENADEVLGKDAEPVLIANLTLAHDRGVRIRLYSNEKA